MQVVVVSLTDMRMLFFAIVGFVVLASLTTKVDAYKSYSQYQLWRLNVTNDEQLKQLVDFRRQAYTHSINFWSEDIRINASVNMAHSNIPSPDGHFDLD